MLLAGGIIFNLSIAVVFAVIAFKVSYRRWVTVR